MRTPEEIAVRYDAYMAGATAYAAALGHSGLYSENTTLASLRDKAIESAQHEPESASAEPEVPNGIVASAGGNP